MDKIQKLSTAIRLGALQHPQCFRHYVSLDEDNQIIATCSLGAAAVAVGMMLTDIRKKTIHERFPDVPYEILGGITYLNDTDKLSREDIADWVESKGY